MRLLFVGDIMPGGVLPYQKEWISDEMLVLLDEFDLRIGTLECALGENIPFDEDKMRGKMNIIYSPSRELQRVKAMRFNMVSLANNHAYDLGADGLKNTIKLLDEAGIKHCGAGMNLEDARKPAVIELNGKKIAFLAYCQYGSIYIGHLKIASADSPGINPLDIDSCIADIKNAKQKYDYVFVMPHWGIEYQYIPTPQCRQWAKQMIDAGADGVFASHTHQVNPLIKYCQRPIAFSMGNFLFPDYYMKPPRPIWYPKDKADVMGLQRFKYYPACIDKPCVQEWRHLSRIGMTVACTIINKRIIVHPIYTYLDGNNKLGLYRKHTAINARMKWMGMMTKSDCYDLAYKFYHAKWNLVRRGYHFLHKLISKDD